MRALVLENNKLKIKDVTKPVPLEGEALVRVLKAGICNTDLELVKGYMDFSGVLGHEFVGQVAQTLEKCFMGKRVAGEINISCGECEYCREGRRTHCPSRNILGIHNKDGAFAEYLTLPVKNLHPIPENISNSKAVFIEPLAAALEILEQISVQDGETVLVLGDGKLGLLIAQVMKLRTGEVCCVGKHTRKLEILQRKGIKAFLAGEKLEQKFDVVVEATGNEAGVNEALFRIKPRGKLVLKSTIHEKPKIDISKIVVDEIQLVGSRCGPFYKAIEVLKNEQVYVEEMIDGDFSLEKALEAFELAKKPEIMKVLISL